MNCLPSSVLQVDLIEYYENSHVKENYEKTKKDFTAQGHMGVSLVYHGTSVTNIDNILNQGFVVGGSEGVGIANGCEYRYLLFCRNMLL
jgi:lipid-binding SYLF domain-containing protein